ncbi:tetraacyldisaccharide 4'-kinase [Algoriphagus sediminis]|uniref:Tetraacyldisaccharide 4'-kinase n=1 Tax=Algoriphagus sediminis TaxID=3057113 RepID=A0ABT7Y7Y3_9BACT|nr:tetraacyldisaccharide 4'-kinase [Algoriphagus sediminis]MDN3202626.1 tetraacyldisaccharide 4'-kinase [Algoriphagus sediminis]
MERFSFLLYPFAVLYGWITGIRNFLFDINFFKSKLSPIPSIIVGNLSVGGTGKTPMVEYLISQYFGEMKLATLSRGYGRKTKGFLKARPNSTPEEIGDEPFQIYQKYGDSVSVFVGEDRVKALAEINSTSEKFNLVILDDAFQHRHVKAHMNILLTTYQKPFYSDFLLPMGRLREYRSCAKRADAVVFTKCPKALGITERENQKQMVSKYLLSETPVLFSSISYGKPYPLVTGMKFKPDLILISGIANPQTLIDHLDQNYNLLKSIRFGDHHDYTESDVKEITEVFESFKEEPVLIITQKDADKVKLLLQSGFLKEIPIFVQPMEVQFSSEDESILRKLIAQKIG